MTIHGIGHGYGQLFHGLGRFGFGALDGDEDGKLSREEVESAGQDLPAGKNRPAPADKQQDRFQRYDTDGSGSLTRTEIRDGIRADMRDLLLRSQEHRDQRRAERLVNKADSNGDGLLSSDELDAFAKNVEPGSRMADRVALLQRFFDKADGDASGGLSTDEIAGFLGQVRTAYRDYVDGLRNDDAFGKFLAERFGTSASAATTDTSASTDTSGTTETSASTATTDATETSASEANETDAAEAAEGNQNDDGATTAPIPFHGRRFGFFGDRSDLLLRFFDQADGNGDGGLTKDEIHGFFKELKSAFRDFVAGLREQDAFGQFLETRFADTSTAGDEPETQTAASADTDDESKSPTTVTTTTTTVTTG